MKLSGLFWPYLFFRGSKCKKARVNLAFSVKEATYLKIASIAAAA